MTDIFYGIKYTRNSCINRQNRIKLSIYTYIKNMKIVYTAISLEPVFYPMKKIQTYKKNRKTKDLIML